MGASTYVLTKGLLVIQIGLIRSQLLVFYLIEEVYFVLDLIEDTLKLV